MGGEGKNPPTNSDAPEEEPFESKLETGRERFLSELLEEVLATGERGSEEFIKHFPPAFIMKSLANEPELRAMILCPTTGIREKLALKKPAESAGVDLRLALEEEVTTADEILDHFDLDDRVRFLPADALWSFMTEHAFWIESEVPHEQVIEQKEKHRQNLVAFVLTKALEHGLLTHDQIVYPVISGDVPNTLSPEQLMETVRKAIEIDAPFTPETFLETIPIEELMEHISTQGVWETVVVPEIAVRHGFVSGSGQAPRTQGPDDEADEGWDPASLAEGIDESNPPDIVSEVLEDEILPEDDDEEDGVAESIAEAVAQATTENSDGPDAEITVEESELSADELMDADDDEGEDATVVVESQFNDGPQIEDGAFERAGGASAKDSQPSSPGSVSSSADLVKRSVIERLRIAGYRLSGVTEATAFKEVIIRALKDVNPKDYIARRMSDLNREKTSVLATSLVHSLRKAKGDKLAGAVLEDLRTIGAASVVAPHPDPKARKPAPIPRPSRKK